MDNFVRAISRDVVIESDRDVMGDMLREYEHVLFESIITSFGLDGLFFQDQHGGDVDTLHNVDQIGKDERMVYKNKQNEDNYNNLEEYNSVTYHKDSRYIETNRKASIEKAAGKLKDAYTGKQIGRNEKSNLDHVISAKEIHYDRKRVLAGLKGEDLANSSSNLRITNEHTNKSKKADSMEDFHKKHGDEYTKSELARMRAHDRYARKQYEQKLATAYYTGSAFWYDTASAAASTGAKMGVKQAVGMLFVEIWFSIKAEFHNHDTDIFSDIRATLRKIGDGIKQGFNNAKQKMPMMISKIRANIEGGLLSSLITTITNIFVTTGKNIVKVLRQVFPSLVQAFKVLFINPDGYSFGERVRAAMKMIATAASVAVGIVASEALSKLPLAQIPLVGDVLVGFVGAFVTGILSVTFLYFLDRSETFNKIVRWLDKLPTMSRDIMFYREQAEELDKYAAELMKIDIADFRNRASVYDDLADSLNNAVTVVESNRILKDTYGKLGMELPWGGGAFESFIANRNNMLQFV